MVQTMLRKQAARLTRSSSRVVVSMVIVLIVTAISIFTFVQVDRELTRSRTAESDNRTWVIAQIEVDVQRLHIALLSAQRDPDAGALKSLRLAFDILYSRVDLVNNAPTMVDLSIRRTETWTNLAGPGGLIEAFVPLIDSDDAVLRAALPTMLDRMGSLALPVREIVVDAISETMVLGDEARNQLQGTLFAFLGTLVVTMIALTLLLTTIYRQAKAQQRHAKMLELAVHNLRATIESSPDAVFIINDSDKVIGTNKAGEAMLGREVGPGESVPLSTILDLGPKGLQPGRLRAVTLCRRKGVPPIPVEVAIAEAETATGYSFKIAFLRDMSDQLRREKQLAAATEKARQGEETKDRFLAVMSHEMRTPLSGLLSATELLKGTSDLNQQQEQLIDIVRACALSALEQVNNVLELTRLSAHDAADYPLVEFSIVEVVEQQILIYQILASQRGDTIRFHPPKDGGYTILAPLPLVRRILNNLLSNAVKFTRNGTIDVRLAADCPARPGPCRFTLSVSDTGIGIDEADLARIFENFTTLDSPYSRAQEGTGLGLGIAKLAAEAMGGGIEVKSRLGQGTCFTVTFDAEVISHAEAAPQPVPQPSDQHEPLNILLAEDNDINRMLLERQLTGAGHMVTAVADGEQALAAATTTRFDIILMDISMPVMDGVTATAHLRERGLMDHTPVIALTAQAAPNRVQALRDLGMAEVVLKPVHPLQLDRMMRQLVSRREVDGASGGATVGGVRPLIEMHRLDELIDGIGDEMMLHMITRFENDMSGALRAIREARGQGNFSGVAKVAHKAAGAAAVLALGALTADLLALETCAAQGMPDDLADRLDVIESMSAESCMALRQRLEAA